MQFVAPRQVSRMKTWRKPLLPLLEEAFDWAEIEFEEWLGVMAKNATKRPEELTEGRILSAPTKAPLGSVDIKCVAGLQAPRAPAHVSSK